MRSRLIKILSVSAVIWTSVMVSSAGAIVIRDDRSDSAYLSLGANYSSVGHISFNAPDGAYLASGTLIDSHWVLTAGHVVDSATSLWWNPNPQGQAFQGYQATDWVAFPKWNGNVSSGYDLGLVHFNTDLSAATGIAPSLLYTGTKEVGQIGTMVGYGTTGTGLTGYTTYDYQKRGAENVIDAVLNTPGKDNRVLLSDFDNPHNAADSSWGSSSPLNLEGLIAPGDSGGGLFLDVGGTNYLAGVNSFGWGIKDGNPDSSYGDAAGFTRVSSFVDWIMSYINGTSSSGGGGKKTGGGGGGGGSTHGHSKNSLTVAIQVPEPGTLSLVSVALLALGWSQVRRRKAAAA